jgi:purine nucleosidase
MPRTFLIDTDTASDDAVALVMALRHPDVRVAGITVVSGNVPLEQGCRNALYTVEMCGSDVPVHAGASQPLLRPAEFARWFHGKDGMGDQNYPAPQSSVSSEHAVDAIVRIAREQPGLTLVTLGPLTNIALALARSPEVVKQISRCIVMGGNPCREGNVTPAAEFNMWVDPEAAAMVLGSGLGIEMVGWQLSRGEANVNEAGIARIRAIDTRLAHFAIDCNRRGMEANLVQTGEVGIALPDPVAMAVALDPSIVTEVSRHRVQIETASALTRGQTVVDRLNVAGDERNRAVWGGRAGEPVSIVWGIDVARWKGLLFKSLGN